MKKTYNLFILSLLYCSTLFAQIQIGGDNANKTVSGTLTAPATVKAEKSIVLLPGFHSNGFDFLASIAPEAANCVPLASLPSQNQNYIITWTARKAGITDPSQLAGKDVCEVNQSVQYFDGLGRPLQTVQTKGSPKADKDLVQAFAYDQYGREAQKFLPYADVSKDGSYKPNALVPGQGLADFYNTPPTGVVQTAYPYAETVFEASPLNRVLEQGAPGLAWQISGGHTVKTVYGSNSAADAVKLWTISGTTVSTTGNYGDNELYKTIIKDENWKDSDGKAGTTEEYKDKEGRLVLKKVWETASSGLSTYYVYDDFGNLRYVIPPAVTVNSITDGDATFNQFIYAYRYDHRNRVTNKKLPGKGWEELMYNVLDQVVLSRDKKQADDNQWMYTKYDGLGRVIITGLLTTTDIKDTLQSKINRKPLWESRPASTYTDGAYPSTAGTTILTVNYYDDYGFNPSYAFQSHTYGKTKTERTKGLLTGTKVNILGTSDYLETVNYYDEDARLIQSHVQNHFTDAGGNKGVDRIDNEYTFTGELKNSTRYHSSSKGSATIANTYEYDHMGRKKQSWQQINGGSKVLLSSLEYNEIGQLRTKSQHNSAHSSTYAYNERGWMSSNNSSAGLFNMNLTYNGGSAPNYNGNISAMHYDGKSNSSGGTLSKDFTYTYDKLNRLLSSTSNDNQLNENLTYDVMGNIRTLARTGSQAVNLDYTNGYTGNQLNQVLNNGSVFRSYGYDVNGNATSDGMGRTIEYNNLNLPKRVSQPNNPAATLANYLYDASGRKLRNTGSNGTMDYVSGIVYQNNSIKYIQTEEGKAVPNGSSYRYVYNVTDHLGNVRLSFDANNGTPQVVQVDEYYAFGLNQTRYNNANDNAYLYNGKEEQTDLQEQYDYGARFYDPVIARFSSIDPKAEKFYPLSGYSYVANNPIILNDPTGKDWTIKREEDEDGNITIRMTLTLAIYNGSNKSFNMNKFLSTVTKQLESTYSAEGLNSEGTGSFKLITDVKARVIADVNDRKKSEHLLEIGSGGEVAGLYGKADKIGGKNVLLNADYVQNMMDGKDNNTVPHEFGHTLGLLHPNEKTTFVEGLIPWNTRNQYMGGGDIGKNPNNVMYSGDSGLLNDKNSTMITRDQISTIFTKYMSGSLNKK